MSENPDEETTRDEKESDLEDHVNEENDDLDIDENVEDEIKENTSRSVGELRIVKREKNLPDSGTSPGKTSEMVPDDEEDDDDESVFDSEGDLQEIFSAMSDVKKEEEKILQTTLEAIDAGEAIMEDQLENMSDELAEKIQAEMEAREAEEEENFVTEEEFIKMHKGDLEKIWYHCLFFLAFKSEDGKATKHGLYESLKNVVSKSPIDPLPEHMFNFGLSSLIKIQLYEKPIVSFNSGEFFLQIDKKMLQDLLLKIGRPLSRRPVITKEEEKKMIHDFFEL